MLSCRNSSVIGCLPIVKWSAIDPIFYFWRRDRKENPYWIHNLFESVDIFCVFHFWMCHCVWQTRLIVRSSLSTFFLLSLFHLIRYETSRFGFVFEFNVSILCELDRQIDSWENGIFQTQRAYFHYDEYEEFV